MAGERVRVHEPEQAPGPARVAGTTGVGPDAGPRQPPGVGPPGQAQAPHAAAATAPPATRPRARARLRPGNALVSAASVAGFLGLWQLAGSAGWIDPAFYGSPSGIVTAGRELIDSGQLASDTLASGKLFAVGFGLSVLIAIPGGIVLGWYRTVNAVFDPLVQMLYVTPRIALIPLIFVWMGIGFSAQVVIVVLTAFFPLLLNTIAGVRAIDQDLLRVARSFMAKDRQIFWTLALPTAVPFIMSGLQLATTMALIGVVVAEFFTGNTGLGSLITNAGVSLQTDQAFVGVVVIAGAALLLNALLNALERRLLRWKSTES
jgi:NitT/TauT family transport system permease protein